MALALILVAVLVFFSVYNGIKEVDQRLVELGVDTAAVQGDAAA